ncbi:protein sprint-like isoform X1 [Macrobrachium nipponense]|uniref:protein sprint-like isoform X1 n=2 Tax=Macrobrachium nipponense TaxID=159736 RepID=UPI0030C8532E
MRNMTRKTQRSFVLTPTSLSHFDSGKNGRFLTFISRALDKVLSRSRCHRCDESDCICWRYSRRDGVADKHMASVGEPNVTLLRAGPRAGDRSQPPQYAGTDHHHHHHHPNDIPILSGGRRKKYPDSSGIAQPLNNKSWSIYSLIDVNEHLLSSSSSPDGEPSPAPPHPPEAAVPVVGLPETAFAYDHSREEEEESQRDFFFCSSSSLGREDDLTHDLRGGIRRPCGEDSLLSDSLFCSSHQGTTMLMTQDLDLASRSSSSSGAGEEGMMMMHVANASPQAASTATPTANTPTTPAQNYHPHFLHHHHQYLHQQHNNLNDCSSSPSAHRFNTSSSSTNSSLASSTHNNNNNNTNTTSSSSSSSMTTASPSAGVLSPSFQFDYDDGGGSEVDDNYQSGSIDGSECEPCVIQLEERLMKTNPIWFLPDLQRSGAVHLLQGKDEGNFIVRQSSKPDTLALSVRLPQDKGPYIQHYLIEIHSNGSSYSLEASENRFDSPPALISYYSQCCDELPVQLRLPRAIQEAKSRHELASLALLGQEFWGTPMASPTASTPTADGPPSGAPTPSPRPNDLSFSSFGKGGVTRGISSTSLLSPVTPVGLGACGASMSSSIGGSTSSLAPTRPAPPVPSPGDRSSLILNLAPLEEFLKEQPLSFSSFRSQPSTPVTPLKPGTPGTKPAPPPRSSPPGTHRTCHVSPPGSQRCMNRLTPPARLSPPVMCDVATPTSESGGELTPRSTQAPLPPPRWARPCLTSSSTSNITVTTTLTLNVNQVKALPLHIDDPQGVSVHVASLEISPASSNGSQPFVTSTTTTPNGNQAGTLNGCREALHLQIRQQITSPQSTPCTPCAPGTPLGEELGMGRGRLRNGKRERRRLSNHYHEANIIENNTPYCRSSLADKISDYEDLWSSPPRELIPTPTSAHPKMSTFKPRSEISKSMGDLSEIAGKSVSFTYDVERKKDEQLYDNEKVNGNSTDSINSYHKTSSPFYMEPADALKDQQPPQARINKASNKLSRKITNRYSDSNIQWKARKSRHSLGKIDSNEDLQLSSSVENLTNGKAHNCFNKNFEVERNRNLENEKNEINASHLIGNQLREEVRRHSRLECRGKPIAPPKINNENAITNGERSTELPWRVDSSWKYLGVGSDDEDGTGIEGRFPVGDGGGESDSVIIPGDRTVQDLISEKLPDLTLMDDQSIAPSCTTRISEYDNVARQNQSREDDFLLNQRFQMQQQSQQQQQRSSRSNIPLEERLHPPLPTHYFQSTVSESGTEFSEPWDSRKWESMMHFDDDASSVDQYARSSLYTPALNLPLLEDSDIGGAGITDTDSIGPVVLESALVSDDDTTSVSGAPTISLTNTKNMDTHLRSRIMSPQLLALRHRQDAENGVAIKKYAMDLGRDTSTTFCRAVSNFITCTLESTERDPAVVTRNVRQFMSGMKNYLVTSGEKEFEGIVKKQRSNLRATEFLNLDAILEDVLVRLVLRPLWDHINKLFVEAYTANGSIQLLATNMKYARSQPSVRLGVRPKLAPPSGNALDTIRNLLTRMQRVYAPREKLEYLLATISHIYQAMYENGDTPGSGDADDLVPVIMWVLSHAGLVSAEVEADYMWGLLLPSASSGEASYYLEAFHSAIHALKNLSPSPESSPGNSLDSVKQDVSVVSDHGVVKIVIPDEKNGSIVTRTLPIRPGTTTREVCKMMAHKLRVTNPQDYALYKLVDGLESLLTDNECPHKVKSDLTNHGFHCTFAFKRIDAKIAWPILS